MRGASLREVQEILGHADMKMTMRYSHLSPSHLRTAVDRLDGPTPTGEPARAHEMAQSARMNPLAPPFVSPAHDSFVTPPELRWIQQQFPKLRAPRSGHPAGT